ncbi:hypothetical protein MRX96_044100 [Rhipicephalus microplus]
MGDHGMDETQTVPALGKTPPLCQAISKDDSRGGIDGAQQTTLHVALQEQSRCEKSSFNMLVTSVEMNNTGSQQQNSEQARMMHVGPRPHAEPLLPPIDFHEGSAKVENKRWKNLIAQAKGRQRKIDLDMFLQQKLRTLKFETVTLKCTANIER